LIYYNVTMEIDEYLNRIEQVSSSEVQSLAQELFTPDAFLTMVLEPAN